MIELGKLVNNIRHVCNYDGELADQIVDGIRNSTWLAELDERLQRAETGVEQVLSLHRRQDQPTRHWKCCADHVPSPENYRRVGGMIKLDKERSTCAECTYTDHYHCTYDGHDSCGHDDYPCNTARAVEGLLPAGEADDDQSR